MRVSLGKITHPEGAELQLDTAPADWIADRLLPWGADVGTRVCAIVPVGYEAYLRVFHHAEEHVGSESIRRRWSELAQRSGRQMHPAVQFDRFAWPNPPQEGSLDRQEATALVSLLRAHDDTEPLLVGHLAGIQRADGLGPGARRGRARAASLASAACAARRVVMLCDLVA